MSRRERPYLFDGATRALCPKCFVVCDAKELIEGDKVYLSSRPMPDRTDTLARVCW